mmetsp:Transcript_50758/g.140496  ORF Transcript_50758/g.140496 Transcript_50758/m.140496 type:complete len:201 (-) Transcript_50758:100-702(-)
MLEVGRAARRERARVGVLGARVGIVGHLRALDVAPRPHLLVEEVEVAHVRVAVGPRRDELLHVGHGAPHAAPHAAVERPVVVGVVAQRVDAQARGGPLLDGEALARVEAAVRIAHDETVDTRVGCNEESPEHAADAAAHALVLIHPDELRAEALELRGDGVRHRAIEVDAHLPARIDDGGELGVAQHADGVARVGAVEAV